LRFHRLRFVRVRVRASRCAASCWTRSLRSSNRKGCINGDRGYWSDKKRLRHPARSGAEAGAAAGQSDKRLIRETARPFGRRAARPDGEVPCAAQGEETRRGIGGGAREDRR